MNMYIVRAFTLILFMICYSRQDLLANNKEIGLPYQPDEQQVDQINISENIDETLFISLGSWCDVAINLRDNGMREAAFPFDWVASVDCEKFLEIFSTDFKYFLDDEYLFYKDFHVFNNYYNLEFPHDYILPEKESELWATFKDKYSRRINRFRELGNYNGRVYFIRSAFGYSNHPERYFKCIDNISISEEYSRRLFDALKERFPRLDFGLIIWDLGQVPEKISENIIRVQFFPDSTAINQLFKESD